MNRDIIAAQGPIVKGRLISIVYCLINAFMAGENTIASAIATNLFFIFVMADLAEVVTLNRKLMRVPKESLEFQHLRVMYNSFQGVIWGSLLVSAIATLFVNPLITLSLIAFHYLRARGEYRLWRIINEDFIERMKKRMEERAKSRARSGVRAPSMAGA